MAIEKHRMSKEEKKLIAASSLGTIFEWYDFYLYGYMAFIISKHFFSSLESSIAFIFSLLAFACGFLFRPLGALLFGHLGDLLGRKIIFISTITIMGVATFLVGLLPTYHQIGIYAPTLLILLRIIQGLAMGGEYGGAIIYVAEFAPHHKRASYTSWIQIAPSLGYFLSVLSILIFQSMFGSQAFEIWAWRLPFLSSLFYLIISIYLRVRMQESAAFQHLKLNGGLSYSPFKEAFFEKKNFKRICISLFGAILGQTVTVGISNLFMLYFLTQVLKVDNLTANICLSISLIGYLFFILLFARMSDKVGRRKLIVTGIFLALISVYPVYLGVAWNANGDLMNAQRNSPIVLQTHSSECSSKLKIEHHHQNKSACDVVRDMLITAGVGFHQQKSSDNFIYLNIGHDSLKISKEFTPDRQQLTKKVQELLYKYHYPTVANPKPINLLIVIALTSYLFAISAMILGPLGAFLIELFPTRIRYTAMSFPYHFGNGFFGGFLPVICFSIMTITGNMFSGLWYVLVLLLVSLVVSYCYLPETKDQDIHEKDY